MKTRPYHVSPGEVSKNMLVLLRLEAGAPAAGRNARLLSPSSKVVIGYCKGVRQHFSLVIGVAEDLVVIHISLRVKWTERRKGEREAESQAPACRRSISTRGMKVTVRTHNHEPCSFICCFPVIFCPLAPPCFHACYGRECHSYALWVALVCGRK